MKFKKALKLLRKAGWKINRISGGHYILVKGEKEITLPQHSGELSTAVQYMVKELISGKSELKGSTRDRWK